MCHSRVTFKMQLVLGVGLQIYVYSQDYIMKWLGGGRGGFLETSVTERLNGPKQVRTTESMSEFAIALICRCVIRNCLRSRATYR